MLYYIRSISYTLMVLHLNTSTARIKNPTRSLEKVGKIDTTAGKLLTDRYHPNNCLIVLSKNENAARSLWETGYQFLNMMLQAQSLGVSYKAILLEENQKTIPDFGD